MDSGWPKVVEELENFLKGAGLTCQQKLVDAKHFGNRLLRYESPDVAVRVVLDRGDWWVELADGTDPKRWSYAEVFRSLLYGCEYDAIPLPDQISFVEENWSVILDLLSVGRREDTQAKLEAIKDARAEKMFPGWKA